MPQWSQKYIKNFNSSHEGLAENCKDMPWFCCTTFQVHQAAVEGTARISMKLQSWRTQNSSELDWPLQIHTWEGGTDRKWQELRTDSPDLTCTFSCEIITFRNSACALRPVSSLLISWFTKSCATWSSAYENATDCAEIKSQKHVFSSTAHAQKGSWYLLPFPTDSDVAQGWSYFATTVLAPHSNAPSAFSRTQNLTTTEVHPYIKPSNKMSVSICWFPNYRQLPVPANAGTSQYTELPSTVSQKRLMCSWLQTVTRRTAQPVINWTTSLYVSHPVSVIDKEKPLRVSARSPAALPRPVQALPLPLPPAVIPERRYFEFKSWISQSSQHSTAVRAPNSLSPFRGSVAIATRQLHYKQADRSHVP
jgi:hypothetical protein